MSANKHRTHSPVPISTEYLKFLGEFKPCPLHSCKGSLTEVYVRYENRGKIKKELECSTCGKIWRERKENWKNK